MDNLAKTHTEVVNGEEIEVMSDEELQKIMEKYDTESNVRKWKGIPRQCIRYLLAAFAIYCVLLNFSFNWETRIERASFVGAIVFMVFLVFPASKKRNKKENYIPWYDVILAIAGAFSYFYFVANCTTIINHGIMLSQFEVILGVVGILVTLEACRRAVGLPIVIVSSCFIIYALTQKSVLLNIYNLFYTTDGVIGTPTRACSTFIVLFVLFGAFLGKTGIADFFIELANSIAGSSCGGPAKVSVIASCLCGMVSGSSVGNTVTTGAVTIPLMKKNGFRPEFAGAVEASSSTGGQIMPPIMGAAAFLMVEYANIDYGTIALTACIPALLYFSGVFMAVHLEAKRNGLEGLKKEDLPKFGKLFISKGYLLLPLVVLVILIMKTTMALAAIVATIVAIIVSMFRKETRMNFNTFIDALEAGTKSTLTVGAACAVAGIIACVITTTGIGAKLITAIVGAANGNIFIAMVLTMLTCIVLGMGVPTTANYVIMATTCAPILISMGMPTLAAHFFVFYFGIVADITPPVALAAFAGSAIAASKPMKTALTATTIATAAYIVPYCFGFNASLILVDPATNTPLTFSLECVLAVITCLLGMFGVASGVRGYYFANINPLFRVILIAGGLCLCVPGTLTDLLGIGSLVVIFLLVKGIGAFKKKDLQS